MPSGQPVEPPVLRRLTTPRAAALAGIVFAVLFAVSLLLLRTAIPQDLGLGASWVGRGEGKVRLAVHILPFAGIAFLWFMGVLRDRMGELEDRFFATVFFGSGLLFLAMVFVSAALAGGLLAATAAASDPGASDEVVRFGRALMLQVSNVYALRMAAVFMVSLGTIWLRTGLMPRWVVGLTFGLALALLVVTSLSVWIVLAFPAWVLVVSLYVLVRRGSPAGLGSG